MKSLLSIAATLAFALAGCATRPSEQPSAAADVFNASGQSVAHVVVRQAAAGLRVRVDANGLAPGVYGVHLHAIGRCDPPAFTSAGPHWNPAGRQHGRDNPQGMHKGDLPNLTVGADGRGQLEQDVPNSTLSGAGASVLLDGDGAALVIHAQADDYRTDPSGNSGARIACGVLRPA